MNEAQQLVLKFHRKMGFTVNVIKGIREAEKI